MVKNVSYWSQFQFQPIRLCSIAAVQPVISHENYIFIILPRVEKPKSNSDDNKNFNITSQTNKEMCACVHRMGRNMK